MKTSHIKLTTRSNESTSTGNSQVETQLHELTHDLVERIKELNCLYSISRLVEQENISLDTILQGVVDLIPPAWQYPDVTCARIRLKYKEFKTPNFRQINRRQTETILVNGRRAGTVEVCYLEERPDEYEGPFLKEERDLIHGIAERLGNIIESKNAEATLRKLYGRERRLRKSLQIEMQKRVDFTRQLVHELKTPLTSLMATSQLLAEETRGNRLEKLTGYVWEGATNLNSRIDELHDVIRGEIGILKLDPKPLDIGNLVVTIVDENKAFVEQHGLEIALKVNEFLPGIVADADRIRQVISNLINNACRYASGGKKIIIQVSQAEDLGVIVIEVKDYGPGISKDKQRRIFKPGYLPGKTDVPGGLGIGLALCKMLVELHGGRLWMVSEVGKGSSFFFTLPVVINHKMVLD